MKQYRFLKLAILAGCLMSVSGCAQELPEPQIVYKAAPGPKVAGWLLQAPKRQSCLDPGKKEYEVKDLEAAYSCKEAEAEKTRGQLQSLQKVLKEHEAK